MAKKVTETADRAENIRKQMSIIVIELWLFICVKYRNVPTSQRIPIDIKITGYADGSVPNAFSNPGNALCFTATRIAKIITANIKANDSTINHVVVGAFLSGSPVITSITFRRSDNLR